MPVDSYSEGTINVTNGSPIVTGNGTLWATDRGDGTPWVREGETLLRENDLLSYGIDSVDGDEQMTLERPYEGVTGVFQNYMVQVDVLGVEADDTGPRQAVGPPGPQGPGGQITIGGTSTLPAGSPAVMFELPGSLPQARIYQAGIPAGFDGATWFAGTGAPDPGVGAVGDFYLDHTPAQTRVYGPKPAVDDWGSSVLITGDQGIPGQSGLPLDTTIRTAAFTMAIGLRYGVDTSAGGFPVTFPLSPNTGDRCGFLDIGGVTGSNPITLLGNGSNMRGSTEEVVVDVDRIGLVWVYWDAAVGWVVDETVAIS